jgi:hypothetical protein
MMRSTRLICRFPARESRCRIWSPEEAPVDQDPQHGQLLVIGDRAQPGYAGADQRHRVRVGGVGLATLTGGEHPRPRRQLRRDVHHLFTVAEQPGGDVPADALAALDRPHPIRPPLRVLQHRSVAVAVGAEPPTADGDLLAGHYLDRGRALVRVYPDHHAIRC